MAGIFLFLVVLSQWYLGFFLLIFVFIFLIYIILNDRKKETFYKLGLFLTVFLILTIPFVYFSTFSFFQEGGAITGSFDEMVRLSADLTD